MRLFIIEEKYATHDRHFQYVVMAEDKDDALLIVMDHDQLVDENNVDIYDAGVSVTPDHESDLYKDGRIISEAEYYDQW